MCAGFFCETKTAVCALLEMEQPRHSFPLYGTKHRASWFQCPFKETKRRGASAPQTQGPSAQHLADVLNENLTHQKEARQCSEEPMEEDTFFYF